MFLSRSKSKRTENPIDKKLNLKFLLYDNKYNTRLSSIKL